MTITVVSRHWFNEYELLLTSKVDGEKLGAYHYFLTAVTRAINGPGSRVRSSYNLW